MSWRLARALDQLRAEVNAAAPRRSTAADGTIGDTAHAARASDHNPNTAGVVRAWDVTHDPAGGCDAHALAERIRLLGRTGKHPALGAGAYVISRGRIASATRDGAAWDWEPYTGPNPHNHHAHVSVATSAAGYDSRQPWRVARKPPRPPTPVTRARRSLRRAADQLDQARPGRPAVARAKRKLAGLLRRLPPR